LENCRESCPSADINFFAMELNENRIQDFLDAAAQRGPQVKQFVRDQVFRRFGAAAPNIQINFVPPPKRNPDGTRVLDAESVTGSNLSVTKSHG
jgi:hypothetical protein